jgi:hypothetical protein
MLDFEYIINNLESVASQMERRNASLLFTSFRTKLAQMSGESTISNISSLARDFCFSDEFRNSIDGSVYSLITDYLSLPNVTNDLVPRGTGESDNVIVCQNGDMLTKSKKYDEIGYLLGWFQEE